MMPTRGTVLPLQPDETLVPFGARIHFPPGMRLAGYRSVTGGWAARFSPSDEDVPCPKCCGSGRIPRP